MGTSLFALFAYGFVRVLDIIARCWGSSVLDFNGLDDLSYVGECETSRECSSAPRRRLLGSPSDEVGRRHIATSESVPT